MKGGSSMAYRGIDKLEKAAKNMGVVCISVVAVVFRLAYKLLKNSDMKGTGELPKGKKR